MILAHYDRLARFFEGARRGRIRAWALQPRYRDAWSGHPDTDRYWRSR